MKLSRRSLLAGLLLCLPLFGVKNKKKRYIKFKKSDGYNCVDPKTKYKCSFKIVPDEEYELISFDRKFHQLYSSNDNVCGYFYNSALIKCWYDYVEYEILVEDDIKQQFEYEILEK